MFSQEDFIKYLCRQKVKNSHEKHGYQINVQKIFLKHDHQGLQINLDALPARGNLIVRALLPRRRGRRRRIWGHRNIEKVVADPFAELVLDFDVQTFED